MSHAMGGRSANRGACAQPCRKKYTLTDAAGKTIVQDKHLLSLRDLNRSASINELAAAGVRSFKIEGRLKDIDYVKNITAYYREALDRLLEEKPEYLPASLGKTTFFFTPDPSKTFHRSGTEYFLHGRTSSVAALDSPKSTGEELGIVTEVKRDTFRISGAGQLANNDGLAFLNRTGESTGIKVNKVENGIVYPDRMNGIYPGAKIYRNYDHTFQMAMGRKTADRKISVDLSLLDIPDGFAVRATLVGSHDLTDSGVAATIFSLPMDKITANDPAKSRENIIRQLTKSGDTPFLVRDTETNGNEQYFFTSQQINELRRGMLEILAQRLAQKGANNSAPPSGIQPKNQVPGKPIPCSFPFPADQFQFENNISNRLAQQFYKRHGVEKPDNAVEKRVVSGRLQVMITRHCIQHELGFCPRFGGNFPENLTLPFSLQDGHNKFELGFDCRNCLMRVYKEI
jgi:putative protease